MSINKKNLVRKEEIFLENIGLIWMCVNRFKDCGISKDELYQTGSMGMLKAINNYDEKKGKFSTYAVYYIIGEIKHFINDYWKIIYDDDIISDAQDCSLYYDIRDSITSLNSFEINFIKYRFYLKYNQKKISEILNCSQAKISRIEKSITKKINIHL